MRVLFPGIIAALSVVALAQAQVMGSYSASSSSNGNVVHGTVTMSGRSVFGAAPVTGAPFSAERVSEHVQVAADGTRFTTNNRQEKIYRDSQGRIRTERSLMMGPNAPAETPTIVEIQDPVAGYSYTLDVQNKVVHRTALQTPQMRQAAAAPSGGSGGGANVALARRPANPGTSGPGSRPHPEMSQEQLGTQVMEGVVAEGHRTVMTWPAGAEGNDRPFQVISENWFSPDLKETVLIKTSDPRSGENTTRLININRDEPPADVFQPPPDFSVVDETGSFEIHWTATRQ
jgi:hypothetical protein